MPNWLVILLFLTLLLRVPSFFEPFHYGDEMIYLTLGEGIRQGVPLYKDLHDNKPPLLYFTAALAGNVFWFRMILAAWSSVTIVIFWKLARTLFPNKNALFKVSTTIFAVLTTIPLLEGNIANSELFMIGPIMLAFLLLLKNHKDYRYLLVSGLSFSVATLFKVPAAFDILAIGFFWLVLAGTKRMRIGQLVKSTAIVSIGFLLPIFASIAWYWMAGAGKEYISSAFLQNIGYLSSWRPDVVKEPFLVKNAPLLTRFGVVVAGLVVLFVSKKRLSKEFIFISAWLLFSLFAVTLSERPYPHYLIQAVPAISLLMGILFTHKNIEQSLTILPLAIAFFVPFYYKFWYYPTSPYYLRFFQFATSRIDKQQYFSSFASEVPRNYQIASYLVSTTSRQDRIFVWGDTANIYALSRRLPPIKYVADYHIKDFYSQDEVVKQLINNMPAYIVILPEASDFPQLQQFVAKNYVLVNTIQRAQIHKISSTKNIFVD